RENAERLAQQARVESLGLAETPLLEVTLVSLVVPHVHHGASTRSPTSPPFVTPNPKPTNHRQLGARLRGNQRGIAAAHARAARRVKPSARLTFFVDRH